MVVYLVSLFDTYLLTYSFFVYLISDVAWPLTLSFFGHFNRSCLLACLLALCSVVIQIYKCTSQVLGSLPLNIRHLKTSKFAYLI